MQTVKAEQGDDYDLFDGDTVQILRPPFLIPIPLSCSLDPFPYPLDHCPQVWKVMQAVKAEQGDDYDLFDGEMPVPLDEVVPVGVNMPYEIITDPAFPGQFRVVSEHYVETGRGGGTLLAACSYHMPYQTTTPSCLS
jgi:hypothetical protein